MSDQDIFNLMSPEEEQRETWLRDTHVAEARGLACLIGYDWPD